MKTEEQNELQFCESTPGLVDFDLCLLSNNDLLAISTERAFAVFQDTIKSTSSKECHLWIRESGFSRPSSSSFNLIRNSFCCLINAGFLLF